MPAPCQDRAISVDQWVRERLPSSSVHLDVAACGRVSAAVLDAQVAHPRAEADVGGYVAEDADPIISGGRTALAALVGLSGEDVAFVESGGVAFASLLAAWPLPSGSSIGTTAAWLTPDDLEGAAAALRSVL